MTKKSKARLARDSERPKPRKPARTQEQKYRLALQDAPLAKHFHVDGYGILARDTIETFAGIRGES